MFLQELENKRGGMAESLILNGMRAQEPEKESKVCEFGNFPNFLRFQKFPDSPQIEQTPNSKRSISKQQILSL
jgi:hypothetical protein